MCRCVLSSASAKRRARISSMRVYAPTSSAFPARSTALGFDVARQPRRIDFDSKRRERLTILRLSRRDLFPFETIFHPMQRSSHRRARARKSEARVNPIDEIPAIFLAIDRRNGRKKRTEESGRETKGNRASDSQRLLGPVATYLLEIVNGG